MIVLFMKQHHIQHQLLMGLPLMIIPDDNPLTLRVALGKKLFFDQFLSSDNSISCASCHIQNNSFSD